MTIKNVTYTRGSISFAINQIQLDKLIALVEIQEPLISSGYGIRGLGDPIYAMLLEFMSTTNSDGVLVPIRTDEPFQLVWTWIKGAQNVNKGHGYFADFIREYTKNQMILRGGDASTVEDLQQSASNGIALQLARDIIADHGMFPDINGVGAVDAGSVASTVFGGDYAPWAGTLLFPYLKSDVFTNHLLLNENLVIATINKKENIQIKHTEGTYDLVAAIQAARAAGVSASLSNFFEAVQSAFGSLNVPKEDQGELIAKANNFFWRFYSVDASSGFTPGNQLPYDKLGFISGRFLQNYIVGNNENNNNLVSSAYHNMIHAGGGDDTIIGSEGGIDILDGGNGIDTISYKHFGILNQVELRIDTNLSSDAGYSYRLIADKVLGKDYLYGVEKIQTGSANDTLKLGAFDASKVPNLLTIDLDGNITDQGDTIDVTEATSGVNFSKESDGTSSIYISTQDGIELNVIGAESFIGSNYDDVFSLGQGTYYINGGQGDDTYNFKTGDGSLYIVDTFGKIVFNNVQLTGGYRIKGESLYKSRDGQFTYQWDGVDLIINNVITVKNFKKFDLGISLREFDNEYQALQDPFGGAEYFTSPLVFDLNKNSIIDTQGVFSFAFFDHNGDGFSEATGWVRPSDGLLVFDKNGDGIIDRGSELFGNNTILKNGIKAANGFEALKEYDSNHDGVITSFDSDWARLQIWRDVDANGYSSSDELFNLSNVGINSISTNYTNSTYVDEFQNAHLQIGSYIDTDGVNRNVTDVWFSYFPGKSLAVKELPVPSDIAKLPNLIGEGVVYDLHQAMVRDESGSLKAMVSDLLQSQNGLNKYSLFEKMMLRWSVSDAILPDSRAYGDAQHLDLLEKFGGRAYFSVSTNSNNIQGDIANEIIEHTYNKTVVRFWGDWLAQTSLKNFYDLVEFSRDTSTKILTANLLPTINSFIHELTVNGVQGKTLLYEFVLSLTTSNLIEHSNFNEFVQAFNLSDTELNAILKTPSIYGEKIFSPVGGGKIFGFYGNDTISGSHEMDSLFGGQGNDILFGEDGDDILSGGEGNDKIEGGEGNDFLLGNEGNDQISGNFGNDTIEGGIGNDTLFGGSGDDVFIYNIGDGNDTLRHERGSGSDVVRFGTGIQVSHVQLTIDGLNLILKIGEFGQIEIKDYINTYGDTGVSKVFEFSDGTRWNYRDVIKLLSQSGSNISHVIKGIENEVNIIEGYDGENIINGANLGDFLTGGPNSDRISGWDGNDILQGMNGSDTLNGGTGDDHVDGGEGDDLLYGNEGQDIVSGGNNDDYLNGGEGDDVSHGGNGNDTLTDYFGNNFFYGDDGHDSITPGQGDDVIYGGLGDDIITESGGNNLVVGGKGNDKISVRSENSGSNVLLFDIGDGNDVVFITKQNDSINSIKFGEGIQPEEVQLSRSNNGDGTDLILIITNTSDSIIIKDFFSYSYQINRIDFVNFSNGVSWSYEALFNFAPYLSLNSNSPTSIGCLDIPSRIFGGNADNQIIGGNNNDTIYGREGNDKLSGGNGDDHLFGDEGNDSIWGEDGNDEIYGGDGMDVISGGAGNDLIVGGQGNDDINGNDGNDILNGGDGADIINGGEGQNTLNGDAGNDILRGGNVDDMLSGGADNDSLYGGTGNDTFFFGRDMGQDIIYRGNAQSDVDIIVMSSDVSPDDIKLYRDTSSPDVTSQQVLQNPDILSKNDLIISIKNTQDSIRIVGFFNSTIASLTPTPIDAIHFANDVLWDFNKIKTLALTGDELPNTIYGDYGDNVINGAGGDDILYGVGGKNQIFGGDGNDFLNSGVGPGKSTLDGGSGNDKLSGTSSILIGGFGNDTLSGGSGGDYVFGLGMGQDTILNQGTVTSIDRIIFGEGVVASNLNFSRSDNGAGNHLIVSIVGTSDQITILEFFSTALGFGNNYEVDEIHFSNGTSLNIKTIILGSIGLTLTGTDDANYLAGNDANDKIYGKGGDDFLYGRAGDDQVFGGDGNDRIEGENGDDLLNGDDGIDLILAGLGNDQLFGGAGDDSLSGDAGDDSLSGGAGDDSLSGGAGNDLYIYNLSDGSDTISEMPIIQWGNADVLQFGEGILPESITFSVLNIDLILTINSASSIRLAYYFYGASDGIDFIKFANGTQWNKQDIASILSGSNVYGINYKDSNSLSIKNAISLSKENDAYFTELNQIQKNKQNFLTLNEQKIFIPNAVSDEIEILKIENDSLHQRVKVSTSFELNPLEIAEVNTQYQQIEISNYSDIFIENSLTISIIGQMNFTNQTSQDNATLYLI